MTFSPATLKECCVILSLVWGGMNERYRHDCRTDKIDRLVRTVINFQSRIRDALDERSLNQVIDGLDELYFSKQGVLPLLEAIAKGQRFDQDELEKRYAYFREKARSISSTVERIEQIIPRFEPRYRREFADLLTMIGYGKFQARWLVQGLIDYLRRDGFSESAVERAKTMAADVVERVHVFNEAIRMAREQLSSEVR